MILGGRADHIAHYSDGIIRMEEVIKILRSAPKTSAALKLKKEIAIKIRNYHYKRYRLLLIYMRDKTVLHWRHEFEELVTSFRIAGIKEENMADSIEEICAFANLPPHPMLKEFEKYEFKLEINLWILRLCHPIKTAIWFFKFVLPKTFKRANLHIDVYADL